MKLISKAVLVPKMTCMGSLGKRKRLREKKRPRKRKSLMMSLMKKSKATCLLKARILKTHPQPAQVRHSGLAVALLGVVHLWTFVSRVGRLLSSQAAPVTAHRPSMLCSALIPLFSASVRV